MYILLFFQRCMVLVFLALFCSIAYGSDMETLSQKAEGGDAQAQAELSQLYFSGKRIPQDLKSGFKWARRSAEQGNPLGQRILAVAYLLGAGVNKNEEEGQRYLLLSAEGGDDGAQEAVGFNALRKKDYANALIWLEKAAMQGRLSAQSQLGSMYAKGLGVEPNLEKARMYYEMAAEKGLLSAQRCLAWGYLNGKFGDKGLERAEYWARRVLENGGGGMSLADTLREKYAQNARTALALFEKGAAMGDAHAIENLGSFYMGTLFGAKMGVKDLKKAKFWYSKIPNNPVAAEALKSMSDVPSSQ